MPLSIAHAHATPLAVKRIGRTRCASTSAELRSTLVTTRRGRILGVDGSRDDRQGARGAHRHRADVDALAHGVGARESRRGAPLGHASTRDTVQATSRRRARVDRLRASGAAWARRVGERRPRRHALAHRCERRDAAPHRRRSRHRRRDGARRHLLALDRDDAAAISSSSTSRSASGAPMYDSNGISCASRCARASVRRRPSSASPSRCSRRTQGALLVLTWGTKQLSVPVAPR